MAPTSVPPWHAKKMRLNPLQEFQSLTIPEDTSAIPISNEELRLKMYPPGKAPLELVKKTNEQKAKAASLSLTAPVALAINPIEPVVANPKNFAPTLTVAQVAKAKPTVCKETTQKEQSSAWPDSLQ